MGNENFSYFTVRNGTSENPAFEWTTNGGEILKKCPFLFEDTINWTPGTQIKTVHRKKRVFSREQLVGLEVTGEDLSNYDFAEANLRMANFSNCILSSTNFRGADLTFANFENAILIHSNFQCANLSKTTFYKSRLNLANLFGADLDQADFQQAVLCGANLRDTNWRSAVFKGAIYNEGTLLPLSDLELVEFGLIKLSSKPRGTV